MAATTFAMLSVDAPNVSFAKRRKKKRKKKRRPTLSRGPYG